MPAKGKGDKSGLTVIIPGGAPGRGSSKCKGPEMVMSGRFWRTGR